MKIEWDKLPLNQWHDIYITLPKTNLIQSYAYAKAMRSVNYQSTRFGNIMDDNGNTLGLVQMQEVRLLKLIHHIFIDRGPLWTSGQDTPAHQTEFLRVIDALYPKRLGRKRRFIPEATKDTNINLNTLSKQGDGYQTIWLDLSLTLDDLMANLNKKWRNTLNRSQKKNLFIDCDDSLLTLNVLLAHYMQDRLDKRYSGASPKLIRQLHQNHSAHEYGLIYSARTSQTENPCAMIYIFVHGSSATYQIGWSNNQGRDTYAHYALLWQAISDLKARGITWLDLGGINLDTAEGVTRFKKGLGGQTMTTIGIYS